MFYWERFGFKDGRQTERSDCYALGMVVYEVLSGRVPFSRHPDYAVIARVLEGKRPARPRGTGGWFTDDIWSTLERCWRPSPGDRPIIGDVFRRLEKASRSWTPPSPRTSAGPPATNLLVRGLKPSAEENAYEGEASSPSEAVSSQPPQKLLLEGDPNENTTALLLTSIQLSLVMPRITSTSEGVWRIHWDRTQMNLEESWIW